MDVFPAFRRREVSGRGRYMRLENDPDATSQHSEHSSRTSSLVSGARRRDSSPLLCDRCWARHEREPATKRCLECRENLCVICARCDEIRRPWWLPTVLVQCWRFFFSKTFIPHSFVELYDEEDEGAFKRRHWSHTQEASHIRPIPRVTRDSLRSKSSTKSAKSDSRQKAYDNSSYCAPFDDSPTVNNGVRIHQDDHLTRSKSFEGFKKRKRLRKRRSRSVDRINEKTLIDERKDSLWNNYHVRAESYENNWDNDEMVSDSNVRRKVLKGKDIDIELSGEDLKVTVNDTEQMIDGTEGKDVRSTQCAVKKTKQKKGLKKRAPAPYTEQIFTDVPIWFKRPSSHKKNSTNNIEARNIPNFNHVDGRHDVNGVTTDYSRYREPSLNATTSHSKTSLNSNGSKSNYEFRHNHNYHRPLSAEQIDARANYRPKNGLNTKETSPEMSTRYIVEEPPDQCPICLEDLPKHEARVLVCSHEIHTTCLRGLLRSTELDFGIRCPVCNQMTTVNNYYAPKELWYRELPVSTGV